MSKIPQGKHVVIEASAGTGKTYTLEHLIVDRLLQTDARIDELLVLTFTKKAATEMRTRVRNIIRRLLEHHSGEYETDDWQWTLDAAARAKLERALLEFDTATIGTIHSFCDMVLKENPFASNRLFQQEQVDGAEAFGRAFRTVLRRQFAEDPRYKPYLAEWLERQGKSVEQLAELLWLCHSKHARILPEYDPDEIARQFQEAPDLTDSAVLEQIKADLKAAKVHGSTIKAVVGRMEQLALVEDRTPAAVISFLASEADKYIGGALTAKIGNPAGLEAGPGRWLVELLEATVPFEAAAVQTMLPPVVAEVNRQKLAEGTYDFDDMIALVSEALEPPGGDALVENLRRRYRFGLIDEFQDTDTRQWNIFRRIFFESDSRNLLYVIGDPKQAIFFFRGADVYTYLSARREMLEGGGQQVRLEKNYRSTGRMIAAYNAILDQTAERPFFTGQIDYKYPVGCGNPRLKCLDATGSEAVPIQVWHYEAEEAEIAQVQAVFGRRIAREIRDLLSGPNRRLRFGPEDAPQEIKARDIFVLTHTGREGYRIGQYLREAGVPYAFYRQEGLFQTAEAGDIRDLLAAIADPTDHSRRAKAWITPFFAVPLAELPACRELPEGHPLSERLQQWHLLATGREFERLLARIVEDTGLIRREILTADSERELTNYLHIFELLLEHARASASTIDELVRTLDRLIDETADLPGEDTNVQRLQSDADAVQIMTVHKSKGLEATVVFLYGGWSGMGGGSSLIEYHVGDQRVVSLEKSDQAKAQAARERAEEHQRLMYVALTRPKARLYLPLPPPLAGRNKQPGPYAPVAERLKAMLDRLRNGEMSDLFSLEAFHGERRPSSAGQDGTADPLARWRPDPDLLAQDDQQPQFDRLKAGHAPLEVTSYTRMAREGTLDDESAERQSFYDPQQRPALAWLAEGDLPGGARTGSFLHAILEDVPLESFHGRPSLADWTARAEIRELIRTQMLRWGIAPRYRGSAERISHTAMTANVRLEGDTVVPGLYACDRVLREMGFLFPFPAAAHPRLSELPPEVFVIERGYIRGFVDYIFEYDGRIYFMDWKSNLLPDYEQPTIEHEVALHYELQAQLYALAVLKLLKIHTPAEYQQQFGGLLYCFLRGMRPDDEGRAGIYFHRPTWEEVLGYEEKLRVGVQASA